MIGQTDKVQTQKDITRAPAGESQRQLQLDLILQKLLQIMVAWDIEDVISRDLHHVTYQAISKFSRYVKFREPWWQGDSQITEPTKTVP